MDKQLEDEYKNEHERKAREEEQRNDELEVFINTDLTMSVLRDVEETLVDQLNFLVGDDAADERKVLYTKLELVGDVIKTAVDKFKRKIGVK